MKPSLKWFGHDSFCIDGSKKIYTDPFKLKKHDSADFILITHTHYDHLSPEDIDLVSTPHTILVGPYDAKSKLKHITTMKPGDKQTIAGVTIEAVSAYNINKQFHPQVNGWLGFIITLDNTRIYLAGDTDRIPEMKTFTNIDIALLPVSGTYVMTAHEAAEAALDIHPVLAIPMHYGSIVGSVHDAEQFRQLLSGRISVEIVPKQ